MNRYVHAPSPICPAQPRADHTAANLSLLLHKLDCLPCLSHHPPNFPSQGSSYSTCTFCPPPAHLCLLKSFGNFSKHPFRLDAFPLPCPPPPLFSSSPIPGTVPALGSIPQGWECLYPALSAPSTTWKSPEGRVWVIPGYKIGHRRHHVGPRFPHPLPLGLPWGGASPGQGTAGTEGATHTLSPFSLSAST